MVPDTMIRARPNFLSSPEEIIEEARNGRMFILVDDEDRENEGDLVIPAQMATPEKINFMATYGRGLICLAMTNDRVDQLGLKPMAQKNGTRHKTAFTTSVEARVGVTTGISANDRARTIAVAIDSANGPSEIVTPGHVFPLIARDGGVLVRAGHTEAAVDVSRLAGLNPSGVICEIMNDDGTMARLSDLIGFSQLHNLKVGTIRDLIAYRRRHDHLVEKCTEVRFNSRWGGEWRAITYRNRATGTEQIALVKGVLDPEQPTLVRMHAISALTDIFAGDGQGMDVLERSMRMIAEEGAGVVIAINRQRDDRFSMALKARAGTLSPSDMEELRDYGVGAMILTELGVERMILLTNTHRTLVALSGYGLSVVGERNLVAAPTD
ncbi:3,4-dihydroxy-2-butanone-4-phosphate synthase [Sphingomonas sp. CFBP 13733]|uniref:3,4-dihydroxy-2-butanone-4-phosphate synthase n=1 Tax=Sphingomonas sp. CFBP 13733 TaxID=2775291 RepID=UPI00178329EC|nr:3,4-dihydroxy-2-butanone-4-phosphate synthase [Sphingomonas sp. CFBP 13733]MBD8641874.1 3,4-dihydroxy-2-butanone-4-phosphate synthase [Sphingomonas sp. CFBP 13733]